MIGLFIKYNFMKIKFLFKYKEESFNSKIVKNFSFDFKADIESNRFKKFKI